jgi:DNA-binding LacI/PurR family transcriptional regulator
MMDHGTKDGETAGARKKYASSLDVARLAGVSQAAVSRTFTEGASVSAKTREKVVAAADKLGYRPSIIPRIMLTSRSSLIAVVSGGLQQPFYASVVERFSREIQKSGSTVLLFSVNHGEYMDEIIPKILSYRVDGVVSALSIVSPEAADSCAKMHVPVVLFNGRIRNEWVTSINSDNVTGGREVAELFIRRGARRFGFIAGRKGNMASDDRMAGYVGRLAEEGVTDLRIEYGNFVFDGGCEAMRAIVRNGAQPDAIFCASDLMAVGALETARSEFKLSVPEDLMIAGFDDIPAASWPSIGLTTIRQDGVRLVSEALSVLDAMISGNSQSGGLVRIVAAPLVERSSTQREPHAPG